MWIQGNAQNNNLGFKSLKSLKYDKRNPRLARTVLVIKNSEAFKNLFNDSRFDCFINLKSTTLRCSKDFYGLHTHKVPAEQCTIDIVNKEGKSNPIKNLKSYFDNFWQKSLAKEEPTVETFINKFDKKNIGTIFLQKDNLYNELSIMGEHQLVSMVDEMIEAKENLLSTFNYNQQCIEEASKAAEEMLKNS